MTAASSTTPGFPPAIGRRPNDCGAYFLYREWWEAGRRAGGRPGAERAPRRLYPEGRFAVPILSGHLGGANDLAREIAGLLGGQAVLTTATDARGIFAFDQWARRLGCAIPDPEKIRPVASRMLAGGTAAFWSQWPVAGECPSGVVPAGQEAAQVQLEAIRSLEQSGQLEGLPDMLRETARLRLEHPEDTLAELAALCDPPATKSALNHRLRKLVELGQARGEGAGPGKTI